MRLFGFIKKELIQMFRNPIMVVAIFIMPLVQAVLISFALNNEPRNIKLAMDCNANDVVMQSIYNKSIASGWFKKADHTQEPAFRAIQTGKADVAIIAPDGGFTKSVGNKEPKLQVLIDATNVIKAQSIEAYVKAIVTSSILDSKLLPMSNHSAISFERRILFNPEMNSTYFLFPFLIVVIVTASILSLTCISITKEKETGTIETLISAPIKNYHIILGKMIPYIGIGFVNLITILIFGMIVFGVPFRGSFAQFTILFFVFAFAISIFGVLLSTFCKTQQQAMLGMMIFLFLSLMLSGGMGAIENMLPFLRCISYALPLSHYTSLARNILLKGSDLYNFLYQALAILIFGIITSVFAVKRFKATLN